MQNKTITVLGQGYIGFPTSLIFAEKGFTVKGYDVNKDLINKIDSGRIPFEEKNLNKIFKKVLNKKYFPTSKFSQSEIYIICVPTPFRSGKIKLPDMSYVFDAIDKIIPFLKNNNTVILESTSPVGSIEKIEKYIKKKNQKIKGLKLAYCPERVLPGNIIYEMKNLDRIVGGYDEKSKKYVFELYKKITSGNVYLTDTKTAEMCKLTENCYRDVSIAFANEIDSICKEQKINTKELIKLSNLHPRVNILNPSIGVGGHCIPVDPWFLIYTNNNSTNLIKLSRKINLNKTKKIASEIFKKIKEQKINSPTIGLLGLTYKENVDDLRESPAIDIAKKISKKFKVMCGDQKIRKNFVKKLKIYKIKEVLQNSDIIFKLVDHNYLKKNKNKKIIDFT